MISPTIGRVVWYHPGPGDGGQNGPIMSYSGKQPLAALVTYVHSDTMVNLAVFDANGNGHGRTSVKLVQDGGNPRSVDESYCEWMPYQKAVAKGDIAPTLHASP